MSVSLCTATMLIRAHLINPEVSGAPLIFMFSPDYMYNVFALRAFLSCRNPTFILELREGKSVPVDMAAGLWCGLVRPE